MARIAQWIAWSRGSTAAMARFAQAVDAICCSNGAMARFERPIQRARTPDSTCHRVLMAQLSGDELLVADRAGWRAWLEEHHDTVPAVWLVLTKKGGAVTALTYEEAVLEALCFGWIDGQARSRDAGSSFIRFTPRGPRSKWSQSNVERVARLEAEGLMTDAGRAAVDAARADGRWPGPA